MSDWTEVIWEVCGRSFRRKVEASAPFSELCETLSEGTDAERALRDLTEMRNAQAHNRGPKGTQVRKAYDTAFERLQELYKSCNWLCDYPLRVIEHTIWDSYAQSGEYTYRELIGDHYLVSEQRGRTTVSTLNEDRLYIVAHDEELHLVSPLIEWYECEACNKPAAFYSMDSSGPAFSAG